MIVARETEKIKGCALENERGSVVQPLPPALRILRQQLLRHKELAAVEAVGAGEHIADTAAQRDQLQPHAAEQLIGQQEGGMRGCVAPQNIETRPTAAENPAGRPSSGPNAQPKVAPM